MLIVRYELSSGVKGEDVIQRDDKWVFGRASAKNTPTVPVDDVRVSRMALVIRDSGPGPVLFRGQRGDAATVRMIGDDGSIVELAEGMAGNFSRSVRRAEMDLGSRTVIKLSVDFRERGTVVERQGLALDSAGGEATGTFKFDPSELGLGPLGDH